MMKMLHVKVCGITREADALLAAELGAAAVGFVFWPGSPRFIDPFRARAIVAALPSFITPVGVFVDQPIEYVDGVASLARLGAVQLHGSESAEYCARVRHRVIKSVPLGDGPVGHDVPWVHELPPRVTLLVDVHDPERHGGTGRTIDWSAARRMARARPVILAGGLRAENVAGAIETVRPYGVDVSSGVETRPGIKDPDRLRRFFDALRPAVDVKT